MDIIFQGYQSSLPLWVYIVLAIGTTALSWWSYYSMRSISVAYRVTLATLRSVALFLLLVLLLNPIFRQEHQINRYPTASVLLDHSKSVTLTKGQYNGQESYRNAIRQLSVHDSLQLNLNTLAFDREVQEAQSDTLQFQGNETNIYKAIEYVRNQSPKPDAAFLFSDGIFTQGRDPSYLAGQLEFPIYTIGLGDTTTVNDLVVKNVSTDQVGYTNTTHPVETTILTQGFADTPVQVQLRRGSEVLQRQTITPDAGRQTSTLSFDLQLNETGLHQYQIFLPELDKEFSAANNRKAFSIDVLDNKIRVVYLASEIHPDIKAVRSVLATNKNIELKPYTWMGNFFAANRTLPAGADSVDLLVLHGYPNATLSSEVQRTVEQLTESTPVLHLVSPRFDNRRIPDWLNARLPIELNGNTSYFEVGLQPVMDARDHPVMELPEVAYNRLPVIYAPIRNGEPARGADVLFSATYRNQSTGFPVVAVNEIGNIRSAQLGMYGYYRWFQSENTAQREYFDRLINNLVSWTSTQPDNQRLKVEPAEQIFDEGEPVVINAFLSNESGQREPNGMIDITLSSDQMDPKVYTMSNDGGGNYSLRLNRLPEGSYKFEAVAQKGNRTIDERTGEFSVAQTNTEFIETRRNEQLLKTIAVSSGGAYVSYHNINSLLDSLAQSPLNEYKTITESSTFYPYRHLFWFITVLLLLSTEWMIRKFLALP